MIDQRLIDYDENYKPYKEEISKSFGEDIFYSFPTSDDIEGEYVGQNKIYG